MIRFNNNLNSDKKLSSFYLHMIDSNDSNDANDCNEEYSLFSVRNLFIIFQSLL